MRRLLVLAILATLALGACSSSGGDDDATTTTEADEAATDETTTSTEDAATTTEGDEGDEGDGPSAGDYEDALTVQLTSGASGNLSFDEDVARCVAERWVEAMDPEALREADVAAADLEDPDFEISSLELGDAVGAEMAQAMVDCEADLIAQFATLIAEGDAEVEACLADEIDPDAFYDLLGRAFGGEQDTDDELDELLVGAAEACGVEV